MWYTFYIHDARFPFITNTHLYNHLKRMQKCVFLLHWGTLKINIHIMCPKWSKVASKWSQSSPKVTQSHLHIPKGRPKWSQSASKVAPSWRQSCIKSLKTMGKMCVFLKTNSWFQSDSKVIAKWPKVIVLCLKWSQSVQSDPKVAPKWPQRDS